MLYKRGYNNGSGLQKRGLTKKGLVKKGLLCSFCENCFELIWFCFVFAGVHGSVGGTGTWLAQPKETPRKI